MSGVALPYIGEIRIFAGNFAPAGWAFCDGQLLPISEYDTLFGLIGTTYGGDGEVTFAVPDLRGRFPMHMGNGFILAETGGAEVVTLTTNQLPSHTHTVNISAVASAGGGTTTSPANAYFAASGREEWYGSGAMVAMHGSARPASPLVSGSAGGNRPHENRPPYLAINFIISLFGIFPSPT